MQKNCPDCRRPYASTADWNEFTQLPECAAYDSCLWGADRCWNETFCGYDAASLQSTTDAAKQIRRGRPLKAAQHEEYHLAGVARQDALALSR